MSASGNFELAAGGRARDNHQHHVVLVTGGAGYVGSLLVRRLLRKGYTVRVLDSLLYGDHAIRALHNHPEYELAEGDFRDPDVVRSALRGVDAVVHLGAIVGDPACAIDDVFTIDTNFNATRTLTQACKHVGISRFIFASTCSVYGASDGSLDEQSALNPVSLYANTKIASEDLLLSEFSDKFSPVILRFGTAYGVSHRPRYDLVVNLLTARAVMDGVITVHGGDQWRPFIHVEDIGKAVEAALEAPLERMAGEVFNVGSTELNFKIGEIGRIIQEIVPSAQVEINDEIIDRRNYYVNFNKLQQQVGFTPDRDMYASIVELVAKTREIGDYRRPLYNNQLYLAAKGSFVRSGSHEDGQLDRVTRSALVNGSYSLGH